MEYVFLSESPAATAALGRKMGKRLAAGTLVALIGELGCGKTLLTRAVCAGLGVPRRQVNSPTFVLVNEYAGRLPVFHLDLYRLGAGRRRRARHRGLSPSRRVRRDDDRMGGKDNQSAALRLPQGRVPVLSARQRRIVFTAPDGRFESVFKGLPVT
jgi:ABC-type dipeptide/oligopeptide/nickel transport system ATPase component